jgi:hypothetical protein
VWKLVKSLYGLKQAPRNWYQEFSHFLMDYGFTKSAYDPCMFFFLTPSQQLKCVLIVYVDDVPNGVTAEAEWYAEFLSAVRAKYTITENSLEWCLGIQIIQEEKCVKMVQTQYIRDVLERFGMSDCKPASIPLDPGMIFSFADSPHSEEEKFAAEASQFRPLVGSLLYAAVATRPDISLSVSKIGHVMSNPSATHFKQATHILRYLKKTMDSGLVFYKGPSDTNNLLQGYCDADLAGCVDSRKSTTGFFFSLNGAAVSWHAKLQGVVALSTTEAEYVALATAGCDALFLRGLLSELGFPQPSTVIFEDNSGCIALTKDSVLHSRTKHIDIRFHRIRDMVASGDVVITYCPTDQMYADGLTKILPKSKFEFCAAYMLGQTSVVI